MFASEFDLISEKCDMIKMWVFALEGCEQLLSPVSLARFD